MVFSVLIVVSLILFGFLTPNFSYVKIQNLNNMLTDAVIPAIFAFGMGIILAGAGFDLSLGHVASLVALVVAYLMSTGIGLDPVSAILVGLVIASGVGCISGLLVSRMGISSFIVTLGMQFLIIGIRQIITGGSSVYISNAAFKGLANNEFGISNLVIVLAVVGFLCFLLMEKSTFGRRIHFIGSNIEASRFMGIDIKNITMSTFILGALLAAFGGTLFAARAGTVQINSVELGTPGRHHHRSLFQRTFWQVQNDRDCAGCNPDFDAGNRHEHAWISNGVDRFHEGSHPALFNYYVLVHEFEFTDLENQSIQDRKRSKRPWTSRNCLAWKAKRDL